MEKMMNLLSKATLALVAASLVGCAFGNNTDEQNKQELDEREKLLQKYSSVIGDYKGTLTSSGRSYPLEASVVTVDEENGKNSKGEPRFIPVLKLRYRQLDTVRPDLVMTTRYIQEDGSLSAVSGQTTLRGTVSSDRITGTVYKSEGVLGKFELTRIDINPSSPLKDPHTDYQDRLREQYAAIAGVYDGAMVSEITGKSTTIRLVLTYYDEYVNGVATVQLRSVLVDPDNNLQLAPPMNASFQLESIPAVLYMGGSGWSAVGNLENDTYSARVSSNQGVVSRLTVKKKTTLH